MGKRITKRLHNQTYSLTVEGECEKLYFLHLQKLINKEEKRIANCQYEPSISIKKNPLKQAKAFNGYSNKFFHIQDIEDYDDEFQRNKFLKLIQDIKKANKYVKYKLGYTNYSFELWIVLHKKDLKHSIPHRNDYIKYINDAYGTTFSYVDEYKNEDNFLKILEQITLGDIYLAVDRAKNIRKCNENKTCCVQNQKKIEYCNYVFYSVNPDLDIHEIIEDILIECFGKNYKKVVNITNQF